MPKFRTKAFHALVGLFAVILLTGPRGCQQPNGVAAKAGSSKTVTPVAGSGAAWADGSLPQTAAEVPSVFIALVNNFRAENGLAPLKYHDGLSIGLRLHHMDMQQDNYFGLANPTTGIDVPTRLVSSTPRIDFDFISHFMLRHGEAGTDRAAWDLMIVEPGFRDTLLDPAATHIGGYRPGHFQALIGYNVVPSSYVPPGPPPPPPSAPATPPPTSSRPARTFTITWFTF